MRFKVSRVKYSWKKFPQFMEYFWTERNKLKYSVGLKYKFKNSVNFARISNLCSRWSTNRKI